ncbi:Rieske (2Fe-2S) protein [Kaarinaea lacus]
MNQTYLCLTDDIGNHSAKEFSLAELELFVVRKDDQFYAYANHCPHTGVNLNWMPNQFLDIDNRLIQCTTHGALFRIEDGYCLRGPCAGQSLQKLPIHIKDNSLFLNHS